MSENPGFVTPPRAAYEILVSDYQWINALEGEDPTRWSIYDIKFYGRSLAKDLKTVNGQYWRWPGHYFTKEEALRQAEFLIEFHRERCYFLEME